MTQASLLLLHWKTSSHTCCERGANRQENTKEQFQDHRDGLFLLIWVLHSSLEDAVELEAHHCHESQWDQSCCPLEAASIE